MRRVILFVVILILCTLNVSGEEMEESLQTAQDSLMEELPSDSAELLDGVDTYASTFVDSVITIITRALGKCTDSLRQGIRTSGILLLIVLLCSICSSFGSQKTVCLVIGALGIFTATMTSLSSMIQLSRDTVTQLTDYSALLLPVMASAMAFSGSPVTAGGIQAITALFAQLLMRLIAKLLIPGVYLYLTLVVGEAALQNSLLGEMREFLSWLIEKTMRVIMYVFTAFLSLTGVISGAADAIAVKAAKAAVSGMIPVVGNIISDASESLLAGTSTVKNSIGVIGLIAVLGITILPFFRVGIQYLLMKATAACSGAVGLKEHTSMLKHISTAMGLLLAMTGICGILLLISGVCYLKVTAI